MVNINEIDVDNEWQNQLVNIELGIPKILRRKSLDLSKINIDSEEEKVEDTQYKQLMPVIKISQYNSTNGLNILYQWTDIILSNVSCLPSFPLRGCQYEVYLTWWQLFFLEFHRSMQKSLKLKVRIVPIEELSSHILFLYLNKICEFNRKLFFIHLPRRLEHTLLYLTMLNSSFLLITSNSTSLRNGWLDLMFSFSSMILASYDKCSASNT